MLLEAESNANTECKIKLDSQNIQLVTIGTCGDVCRLLCVLCKPTADRETSVSHAVKLDLGCQAMDLQFL